MLASKLLVALFALPLTALAQDASDAADTTAVAGTTDAAAAGTDSAAAGTETGTSTKTKAVGADINNTGNGQSSGTTGNWSVVTFSVPNANFYWVNNAQNTAVWSPYTEPVDLVLFNSNSTIFAGNKTIASDIPAGTGSWVGQIDGFIPGNNYILAVAPSSDKTRKVGQTRGFWIKREGTVTMVAPSATAGSVATGAVSADSTASGAVSAGASAVSAGASAAGSASSGLVNAPATTESKSSASALAVSFGAVAVAALAAVAL